MPVPQNAVKPGEAVVDASGMIGRIYLAGNTHQLGNPAHRPQQSYSRSPSHLASAPKPGNAKANSQAIMAGDNTAMPSLDTLSSTVVLEAGDQVVSSGDGGLLPPGLPIGTVVATNDGYRVALLADAYRGSNQDVEVLAFRQSARSAAAHR